MQIFIEFIDHFEWFQATSAFAKFVHPSGQHSQQRQITFNDRLNVGTQYFHRDFARLERVADLELYRPEVHLRHARACNRLPVEARKDLIYGASVGAFQCFAHVFLRKRRHSILQERELRGYVRRYQVWACGQDLPKLDKDWSERFERRTQTRTAWRRMLAITQYAAEAPQNWV